MSLIPAFGKLRQTDLCEIKASLVYMASGSTASKTLPQTTAATAAKQKCSLALASRKARVLVTSWAVSR